MYIYYIYVNILIHFCLWFLASVSFLIPFSTLTSLPHQALLFFAQGQMCQSPMVPRPQNTCYYHQDHALTVAAHGSGHSGGILAAVLRLVDAGSMRQLHRGLA